MSVTRGTDAIALAHWQAQMRPAEWLSRTIPPPVGWVWASDGENVWLIHTDGLGIGHNATLVHYWTRAFIPAPPKEEQ